VKSQTLNPVVSPEIPHKRMAETFVLGAGKKNGSDTDERP
jgi:hypothetical protein